MGKAQAKVPRRILNLAIDLPLDAKRKPTRKNGIESWYPYYAGFTEDFAYQSLQEIGKNESLCVMDPWNGSGTTTRVAHVLGHRPLGFDINPVASLVASAKIAHAEDAKHIIGFARRIAMTEPIKPDSRDPLLTWLAPSVVAQYRGIERTLLAELATSSSGHIANVLKGELPPLASFLLFSLIRTARSFASVQQGSNPTWIRPGEKRNQVVSNLCRKWITTVNSMAEDLESVKRNETLRPWCGTVGVENSKALPVEDESVDLILTSPPYCTRIDYVVSTSFELAALRIGSEMPFYEDLRRATMGTPLARRGSPPAVRKEWPRSVSELLGAIREHPSKASGSYYYKTFWQYFDDASNSLREFHRTLRTGAVAILVVQTSYYKELLVNLPKLYIDMAEKIGFYGSILGEAQVRRALAQINPRASFNKKNAYYREAVVVLEKAK